MSLLDKVEGMRGALDYHLARHNVLVSNLAQVDTPEYTPVDLAREEFSGELGVALAATDRDHIAAPAAERGFHVVKDPEAAGADGNGVDVDREAVKIASNQMRYDMLAQLASSELATLGWAAGDGRTG